VIASHDLEVIDPGLLSTVQDRGRKLVGAQGVSPAGCADWFSAKVANGLVGNPASAALVETTLNGITLIAHRALGVAVTGADAPLKVNDAPAPLWQSLALAAGDRLQLGAARSGVRNYLALAGGLSVSPVLGSASTDLNGHFGGVDGRPLRAGDLLQVHSPLGEAATAPRPAPKRVLRVQARPAWKSETILRVLAGPQFSAAAADMTALFHAPFAVTQQCNRQGARLRGVPLQREGGWDAVSFGVCAGCIQVTNDGQPIILLCDHQTTGGYGVPAVVIAADLPLAAQLRPGDSVVFEAVKQADAAKAFDDRLHDSGWLESIA